MSARLALPAVFFALSLLAGAAPSAGAGAWSLAPGEYFTQFLGGWSSSDFYYDQDGKKRPLANGGLWEERSVLSYTELGWKPRLSFILGIPAKSVTRRFGAAGGGRTLPTASGLADGLVGFRYNLENSAVGLAIELDWKPPLSYERSQLLTHQDSVRAGDASGDGDSLDVNVARQLASPRLGDGQQDVTLALHVGAPLSRLRGFFQFSGGYRYRFENPGDQLVASVDLAVWPMRSLLVGARYELESPVRGGDRATDHPERYRVGPTLVYRVDDRMDLVLASMHTAAANNALHADELYVGVAFRRTKLNRLQGFLGNSSNP